MILFAPHCYRVRQDAAEERGRSDEAREARENSETARLWISGVEAVQRQLKVRAVYDLSATPFFLPGSGHPAGSLFPWVVSDFSLIDAIESGVVKLPRVPVSDNLPTGGTPLYRNLWPAVRERMPNGTRGGQRWDPPDLPLEVKTALDALYGSYDKTFRLWEKDAVGVPPVFIVVCANTIASELVYEFMFGYHRTDEHEQTEFFSARYDLFSNFAATGDAVPLPRTLLIDSIQIEKGDTIDDTFRKAAAAEKITDAELQREAMNMIGRQGRLGEQIRCVVSVGMLTEGWDANTGHPHPRPPRLRLAPALRTGDGPCPLRRLIPAAADRDSRGDSQVCQSLTHCLEAGGRRSRSVEGDRGGATGFDGGGPARDCGEEPGCAGVAADVGAGSGSGGRRSEDGGGDLRNGSADAAGLGSPLQCRGAGGAREPPGSAAAAAARSRPGVGAGVVAGGRARSCGGRGGALAAAGPAGADRLGLRGRAARADGGQVPGGSAIGGSRCARGIRRPIPRRRRLAEKLPGGGSRGGPRGRARQAAGDLVPGRGAGRPAGHPHLGLGQARHPAAGAPRYPLPVGLHLRRGLPGAGRRRGARHALRRHPRDERPSRRDRPHRRAGRARPAGTRRCWLARRAGARHSRQCHPRHAPPGRRHRNARQAAPDGTRRGHLPRPRHQRDSLPPCRGLPGRAARHRHRRRLVEDRALHPHPRQGRPLRGRDAWHHRRSGDAHPCASRTRPRQRDHPKAHRPPRLPEAPRRRGPADRHADPEDQADRPPLPRRLRRLPRRDREGAADAPPVADEVAGIILGAINMHHAGTEQQPIRAVLAPYGPVGSTLDVGFNTATEDRHWANPLRSHVNWIVCDGSWERNLAERLDAHPRVIAYTKNHNRGFEVPYCSSAEARNYRLDFIVWVDDGHGGEVNLVLEVKGFRDHDAMLKATTMKSQWIPGVNRLGRFGRWAFDEPREIHDFGPALDRAIAEACGEVTE